MYIAIAVRGRSYNICRPDTCIIHANFIGQVSMLQRMSRNIFSLSVTIKMALCGSQQRNLMWYMFGILFIVLGICSNNIARTAAEAYKYGVNKVDICPQNKTEWEEASMRLNCSNDTKSPLNRYHCLPVHDLTILMEFCYNRTRPQVVKGLCMVYVQESNYFNSYNCTTFEDGCPDMFYLSDESYKYPKCMDIDPIGRCYLAESSCKLTKTTSSDITSITRAAENSSSPASTDDVVVIPISTSLGFLVLTCIVVAIIYKRRDICYKHKDIPACGTDIDFDPTDENPLLPMSDLVLLSKVKVDDVMSPSENRTEDLLVARNEIVTTCVTDIPACGTDIDFDPKDYDPLLPMSEVEEIVAAIGFGTTYSGFAFSLPRSSYSEVILQKWVSKTADKLNTSPKTPTSLLLDDKNDFVAFGFDAEEKYNGFVEDGKHEHFRFFKNFKMKLHREKLYDISMDIEDHLGKPLAALEFFSKSLAYMKEEVLKKLKSTLEEKEEYRDILISSENIHWIVTVPAIWDDFAKKFIRVAAEKANIPSKQLTLPLEPECAAIYALTRAILVAPSKQSDKTTYNPGEKFLVADLGGGTADFSVVEITENHELKHLHHVSGEDCGGKKVNKNIFNIYEEIFGKELMEKFLEKKAEILEMENEIEVKKRDLSRGETLSLTLSPALADLCPKLCRQMIEESMYRKCIEYKRGKIVFPERLVDDGIFKPVVRKIADHMKSILKEPLADDIKTIILVGGFAKSNIVQVYIKDIFPDTKVIIPIDPGLAVLKGAVTFGQFEGILKTRVCDYTYGFETNRFCLATDPRDKIKRIGDELQCTQVFEKMVTIGDQIRVNEKVEKEFKASPGMRRMKINIYKSKDPSPLFITDKGCELFAEMTIEMPDTKGGVDRAVIISIQFGKTDITISARDKTTGRGKKIRMV